MDKYNALKNKKLFKGLLFIVILFFIIGLFVTIFLSSKNNTIINDSLNSYIEEIKVETLNKTYIKNTIMNYIIINTLIFILTMSIIGIPINIVSLAYKSFSLSFTIFNVIKVYKINSIFMITYVLPDIFNLIISLIYSYYLIRFSKKILEKLFKKENIDLKRLIKKNIKLFIICLLIFILNTIIKIYVVPSLIKPFTKYLINS